MDLARVHVVKEGKYDSGNESVFREDRQDDQSYRELCEKLEHELELEKEKIQGLTIGAGKIDKMLNFEKLFGDKRGLGYIDESSTPSSFETIFVKDVSTQEAPKFVHDPIWDTFDLAGFTLDQSSSIEKMLKKFNYFTSNPVSTPYDPSVSLKKNNGEPMSQLKYSQMIGSLMYIANKTRADTAYAVGRLSRYTHNPKRVFTYLRGTLDYSICKGFPCVIEGYSDANWITDNYDEEQLYPGHPKQTIISRSTMEPELIALDTARTETEWIKNFLLEIPLVNKPIPAFSIHCDNKVVIDFVRQAHTNKKMNGHIQVRYKSVRSLLNKEVVSLDFVKSEKNIADQLTKGLSRNAVLDLLRGMSLSP
ncbi:hypothetical protein Prudu_006702 [Prunus dulcis]|uniref:Transposable element protein n=1 Tax=Prunus dulcis TaxID=3755 RepID=A0A4Y1R0C1_PRUDU|nr:hypothetical protein Prudu_006702 [Prunus dulcis]